MASDAAELVRYRLADMLELEVDYAIAGRVEASLRDRGVQVADVRHGAQATLRWPFLPAMERAAVTSAIAELTGGRGRPVGAGTRWFA